MIFEIKDQLSNSLAFKDIDAIGLRTKKGIRESFFKIGLDLKYTARRLIVDETKSGRIYTYNINGRIVRHISSAHLQSPANLTGKLLASIGYDITGSYSMVFGAGNFADVRYAKFLERGTVKMKQRPFLIRAINLNERNNYVTLNKKIEKELNK